MPDYEFKSYILNKIPLALQSAKSCRKVGYYHEKIANSNPYEDNHVEVLKNDIEKFNFHNECSQLFQELPVSVQEECDRMLNADKERRKRLRKKINSMFSKGRCYFITLTFSDDTMKRTDVKDRRVMVSRLLKTVSAEYVGNVDYGSKKGREHYHAIIRSDMLDDLVYEYHSKYGWICSECSQFAKWSKNGFYSIKSCNKDENDIKKLASYVTKLTNHAIKETTKRNALIYSR